MTRWRSRQSIALIVAGWVVAIGAVSYVLARTPVPELREQLKGWQFWSLELQFVVFALLTVANAKSLRRILQPDASWRVPLAASVLALVLVCGVAPRTNRIYYDEQIYQHIGQNLSDLRKAQMCNDGSVEFGILRCASGEYNKQPYGYPHLLSVLYRVFGVHEDLAFWLNNACAFGLVWVVYCTTLLLFQDRRGAGFAALVAALIPEQLRWSNTAAVEPSAALACAIAVLCAAYFIRTRSTAALLWLVCAAACAAQFRTESLLIVPVAGLIVVLFAADEITRPRLWGAALFGFVLCAPLLAHMFAVRAEPWGASGPRTSFEYVVPNLAVNGPFYYADWRFPALYSGLAVVGLLWNASRAALVTLFNFAAFWAIFLVFYAGSYNYGADVRYSLMSYPPLAVLAGVGASRLADVVERRSASRIAAAAIVALIGFQFLLYMPYVRAVGEEAWAARADVDFAREFAAAIPADGLVLTQNPNMFLLWGISAAQISVAVSQTDYVRQYLMKRYRGGVYLHFGFWCNVADPVQVGFCSSALAAYPHELMAERTRWSYRYALYRLRPSTQ